MPAEPRIDHDRPDERVPPKADLTSRSLRGEVDVTSGSLWACLIRSPYLFGIATLTSLATWGEPVEDFDAKKRTNRAVGLVQKCLPAPAKGISDVLMNLRACKNFPTVRDPQAALKVAVTDHWE